ncbi:MAG: peptidylprolyl isomerase [Porticoccaceae bacterium]|nr:MAG: peptidylprolyl isomerase [Porticoccaceae bacterium]
MLQKMRDNLRGVTAMVLVGLLAIPFAFFGVEALFFTGAAVEAVATVDGEKITRLELDRALEFQRRRLLEQLEGLDSSQLDDALLRDRVLDRLIEEKALAVAARRGGIAVADRTFQEMVARSELFREGGRFSPDLYRYHLGRLGFTPSDYRRRVEEELAVVQLTGGVVHTAFLTEPAFARLAGLLLEERTVEYFVLRPAQAGQVEVTAEEVEAYFGSHREEFRIPEQVVVEYVELSPELLAARVEVTEQEVERALAEARERAAQRRVWQLAHIQIDPAAPDRQERVEAVRQGLAVGEPFAALARKYSDDFGSRTQGGELGTFTEETLPPGFAEALSGAAPGEVIGPVELPSGVHFIQVQRVEAASPPPREEVERRVRLAKAREKLPTLLERLREESFSADSLASVAEALDLPLKRSEPFSRRGGEGIAAHPAVRRAAFSPEVLEEGLPSEVLELGSDRYAVIRVVERTPSRVPELAEVEERVRTLLEEEKRRRWLAERAASLVAQLSSGAALVEVATSAGAEVVRAEGVGRFDGGGVPQPLREAIFAVPADTPLPVYGRATLADGTVAVYALRAVRPGDPARLSEAERRSLRRSLERSWGEGELRALVADLVSRARIERRAEVVESQQ